MKTATLLLWSALAFAAAPLRSQSLPVTASAASVRVYDSTAATATPRDVLGRRVPTAPVTWGTRPLGHLAIRADSASKGQRATIAGLASGPAYAIASWKRSDGKVIRDSVRVDVTRPLAARVSVYFAFQRLPDGSVRGDSVWSTTPGASRCVYVVARDTRGFALTGLTPQITISNRAVASVSSSGNCPDTTVDPAKLVP
jgi:hypothetical protein